MRLPVLACLLSAAAAAQSSPTPPLPPLLFEPTPHAGEYYARSQGVSWRFRGATMLARSAGDEVRIALCGASATASIAPLERAPSTTSYYLGNDPTRWREQVPNYTRLRVRDALPGVDLVHHGSGRSLEFDLVLQPGAPTDLRLSVDGARSLRLCDGALAIGLADGELRLQPPVVYQQRGSRRERVPCSYGLLERGVAFRLGTFDPALELTIDPVVTFATLLGGNGGQEVIKGVGTDRHGAMAVVGYTEASDFPVLNNLPVAYRFHSTFVTRFDAQGTLAFSTFFGGTTGSMDPVGVGMDFDGQVVFGGNTTSADMPTTSGVVQPAAMASDWFFADLSTTGTLNWSTYYGGAGGQNGMKCLKVLETQRGSVLGVGVEGAFPFMPNCYSQTGGLVVAGIFGGNVVWASSACGISATPYCVDVDSQGHICIAGSVNGISNLPTTATAFQPTPPGGVDGFVFVFTGLANSLVFATHFGGSGNDIIRRIVARPGPGTIACTIAGETYSTDLPLLQPAQAQNAGSGDAFVARLDSLTQTLDYSTWLGGNLPETVRGLTVDSQGFTTVAGDSHSTNLPFLHTLKLTNPTSNGDVWMAQFSPQGALQWFSCWGGGGDEVLADMAVGPDRSLVIAGHTGGLNMPTTANALPGGFQSQDGFLCRLDPRTQPSYGSGTPGFWGFVPVLAAGGPAQLGSTAQLQVHDGRAQAFGVLAVGFGRINLPLFGGALLVNPLQTIPVFLRGSTATTLSTRGGGYLHYPLPIPNLPGLSGMVTDWQAAFFDAAANGGIALTNGVEITVQ